MHLILRFRQGSITLAFILPLIKSGEGLLDMNRLSFQLVLHSRMRLETDTLLQVLLQVELGLRTVMLINNKCTKHSLVRLHITVAPAVLNRRRADRRPIRSLICLAVGALSKYDVAIDRRLEIVSIRVHLRPLRLERS